MIYIYNSDTSELKVQIPVSSSLDELSVEDINELTGMKVVMDLHTHFKYLVTYIMCESKQVHVHAEMVHKKIMDVCSELERWKLKKTFKVEVKEILSRIVEVEAESDLEAVQIVSQRYSEEEIVLNHNDICFSDISIYIED